jgi:hypothetical protein
MTFNQPETEALTGGMPKSGRAIAVEMF